MKTIYLIGVIAVFFIAQATIVSRIAIGEISPDLVLLVVIFFALKRGAVPGAVFGFVIGFFQDLGTPETLGLNAMCSALVGFMIARAMAKTFPENMIFMFALFFIAALGHDGLYLIFYMWPNIGGAMVTILVRALPSAIYTAIAGLLADRALGMIGDKAVTPLGQEGQQ